METNGRRVFLSRSVQSGIALIATRAWPLGIPLGACASYGNAGRGIGFAPWDFPDPEESRPEMLAVHAAILAASPHNTQPWLFRVSETQIDVYVDATRSLGAMDSLGRERYLGLGCAIENAVLSAQSAGREVEVTLMPTPSDETHAATLRLRPAPPVIDPLVEVIAERRMNKFPYAEVSVPPTVLAGLATLAQDDRIALSIFTALDERALLRQHSIDAVVAISRDPEMSEASHRWWRQTPAEVEATSDGLSLDILGLDSTTRALAGAVAVVSVSEANAYWIDATRTRHTTGAGYFVLSSRDRNSREEQLLTGRLFQRAHLYLTRLGVDAHTINMIPEMQDREESSGASARPFTEASARWVPSGYGFQMLTRFGYGFERAFHTPRRSAESVLR